MKKKLSIFFVAMLALSILLTACAPGTPAPTPTPTYVLANPGLIIGTWVDDSTGVEWTYSNDGSLGSSTNVIAKFTFDGYHLKITNWNKQVITPTITFDGDDKMIETAGNGKVIYFTRKKK